MHRAEASIDVDVPVEHFYDTLCDFEGYPAFLTSVVKTTVLEQQDERYVVSFRLHVLRQLDYVIALEGTRPTSLSWNLVRSNVFEQNDGEWRLEPLGESQVRAHYAVDISVSAFVPRAFVNQLVELTLPQTLSEWKARAEATWKRKQVEGN